MSAELYCWRILDKRLWAQPLTIGTHEVAVGADGMLPAVLPADLGVLLAHPSRKGFVERLARNSASVWTAKEKAADADILAAEIAANDLEIRWSAALAFVDQCKTARRELANRKAMVEAAFQAAKAKAAEPAPTVIVEPEPAPVEVVEAPVPESKRRK